MDAKILDSVESKVLLYKNYQLLIRKLQVLPYKLCETTNRPQFNHRTLHKTQLWITLYWRIVQKKGVNISMGLYRALFNQLLLQCSREQDRRELPIQPIWSAVAA